MYTKFQGLLPFLKRAFFRAAGVHTAACLHVRCLFFNGAGAELLSQQESQKRKLVFLFVVLHAVLPPFFSSLFLCFLFFI